MNSLKNNKLAILIPSLLGGGSERVVITLTQGFVKLGIDTHLFVLERGKDYETNDEITVIPLSYLQAKKSISLGRKRYLYIPKQSVRLLHYIRKHKIKTVLSFQQRANLINIALKAIYHHTAITNVRSTLSKAYKQKGILPKIKYKLNKYINYSNTIICNSNGIKNDLITNFHIKPEKINVIYNPYDIELIKTLSKEQLEPEYKELFNAPVIINVGRFMTPKAQWHLIRAYKRIKSEIKDAKLVILGAGGFEQYLKQLAISLGFENEIHFLGFQKNPFKFVSKAKVFVLSSLWEGFPNVLVEAMICGTPVISTDCRSGPREILAPDTDPLYETKTIEYAPYGILVPVMDGIMYNANDPLTKEESLLADAITTMLKDENMRNTYSAKALRRVEDFNKDKIIKEYLDVIFPE